MDSADSPLVVDRLYGDRRRQLPRHGIGGTSGLGRLLALTAALSAHVQRSVYVRPALRHQVAWRTTHRRVGANAMSEQIEAVSEQIKAAIVEYWRGRTNLGPTW